MLKRLALFLLLAGIILIVPSSKAQSTPTKILFVGDSITELGSFRYHVYCRLRKDGYNVDFVGSNKTHGPPYGACIVDGQTLPFQFDPDSEGHSGWTTGGLAGSLRGWVQTQQPDYVLIHTGTNDVLGSPWTHMYDDQWGNKGVYTYLKKMLADIKAVRPTARILLALTVNTDPLAQNSAATVKTADLNGVIRRVYDEEKNNYNLYLVDQNTGFNSGPRTVDLPKLRPNNRPPTCDWADVMGERVIAGRPQNSTNANDYEPLEDPNKHSYDCIHPNGRGGELMAQKWYNALAPLLAGQPVPTLPPGVSPTITPTPSRIPTAAPTIALQLGQFYKGINIYGDAVTIDGRQWLAEANADVTVDSNRFRDPSTPLIPSAPAGVEAMIRDAAWGRDGKPIIYVNNVPNGTYGVYLYIWEDNAAQTVNFAVQDIPVAQNISSGSPGSWAKLGPFTAVVTNGRIKINAFGSGDANISGIEIWTANGTTISQSPTSAITAVNTPTVGPTPGQIPVLSMKGLKVQGNKVVNENGQFVKLVGVNISGTEYSCVGGKDNGVMPWGIFEVPANQETINGLKKWNINTVRVPLNESCWNGIPNPDTRTNVHSNKTEYLGKFASYSGETYRTSITNWVNLLTQNNIAVVVEIHWSAPGTFIARDQTAMLNRDNSIRAWTDIANRFKNNSSVLFDLHNEPYSEWKDWNQESTTATWNCWKKGSGTGVNCAGLDEWWDHASNSFNGGARYNFQAAGMDEVTAAVRATGAQNIIILGGLTFANNMTHFLQYKPNDPNIMASIHNYNFNVCDNRQCWEQQYKPVAQVVPVIAGEVGQSISVSWRSNLDQEFVNKITAFYDENNIHYLAWLWNDWGCDSHQLVSNYDGTVNRGCKHSEDLYRAMQKTLASHNPGSQVTLTPAPTTPPNCTNKALGDADCDTKTSLIDYELLRRGITSGNLNADFNNDGKVTIDDFTNWLANFLF